MTSSTPSFSMSGNIPVGDCCICDTYDSNGELIRHIDQFELYKCQNPDCLHWACKEHFVDGLCYGCSKEV